MVGSASRATVLAERSIRGNDLTTVCRSAPIEKRTVVADESADTNTMMSGADIERAACAA